MHYRELGYFFERHGGLSGYDALPSGPDEALNFRDMFLFGCTVQVYVQSIHFLAEWVELKISVHMCDLETVLQA